MTRHAPTIKQLEALYWSAQLGSFQAAADKLFTSQSAIAKRVGELESLFNTRLLDRSAKQNVPTLLGNCMVKHAEEVLAASSRLVKAMSSISSATSFKGTVRIASIDMFVKSWLTELVDHLHDIYPQLSIGLEVDSGQRNIDKLKQGHADIAFCPTAVQERNLGCTSIGATEFAWLVSPKLGLCDANLSLQEFAQLPRVVHSSNHLMLPAELIALQSNDSYTVTANTFSMMVQLTQNGHGACYLPTAYLQAEIESGLLCALHVDDMPKTLDFFAVYRTDVAHPLALPIAEQAKTCFARHQCELAPC